MDNSRAYAAAVHENNIKYRELEFNNTIYSSW